MQHLQKKHRRTPGVLLAGLNHRNTPSGNVKSSRAFPLSTLSLPLLPASNHRLRATSSETRILHKQSSGINTFRVIVPKSSRLTPSRPGRESDSTIQPSRRLCYHIPPSSPPNRYWPQRPSPPGSILGTECSRSLPKIWRKITYSDWYWMMRLPKSL